MKKQLFSFALPSRMRNVALTCSMIGSFAICQAQAMAMWIGSWDYVLRNDADGKPQAVFARLRGDGDALLWLTCSKFSQNGDDQAITSVAAAVSQKAYLGYSSSRGRSTVYWFDNGSPELGYWIYRDRVGHISGWGQVTALLDKLTNTQKMVIELSNYRYEAQRSEFTFNENDTKTVAERFRQDCQNIIGPQHAS